MGTLALLHDSWMRRTTPAYCVNLHPDFKRYYPIWTAIRDACSGEPVVKERGQLYLHKPKSMSDQEYNGYIARSVFFNGVGRTRKSLLGSVFRIPPDVTVPKSFTNKIDLTKITKMGQDFRFLIKDTVREVLTTGRYGILIDSPIAPNLPAYAVGYTAEHILNWRIDNINGQTQLAQVILLEQIPIENEMFGVSESYRNIIRILELVPKTDSPDSIFYYQQTILTPDIDHPAEFNLAGVQIVQPVIRGSNLTSIPFVFITDQHLSPEVTDPPLQDILTVNLSHYQSYAELEHGRYYAAMPVYYVKGMGNAGAQNWTVGPNVVWNLDQGDDPGILEFKGSGLTYLESALSDKEAQMTTLGAKLLTQQARRAATSETMLELLETGDQASLADICIVANLGLSKVLSILGQFASIAPDPADLPRVKLNEEYSTDPLSSRDMRAIQSLYSAGLMPLDVMYSTLRQSGLLPAELSLEKFKALLDDPKQKPAPPLPGVALPTPAQAPSGSGPGTTPPPTPPAPAGGGGAPGGSGGSGSPGGSGAA